MSGGAEGRSYQALGLAAQLFTEGAFTMPVARTFSLDQAADAHLMSQGGHVRGKFVVVID